MCSYNLKGQNFQEMTKQVAIKNPICGYITSDGVIYDCLNYQHLKFIKKYIEDNQEVRDKFDQWLTTEDYRETILNTRGSLYDIFMFSQYNWVKVGAYAIEKDASYPKGYKFFMLMLQNQTLTPEQIDIIYLR